MKAGRLKGPNNRPARSVGGRGQAADRTLGARNRTRDNRQPRQSRKCSLQGLLVTVPGLSADDVATIEAAGEEAMDAAAQRAWIAFQQAMVNRATADGSISAKDCVTALAKIGGQILRVLQVQAATARHGTGQVRVICNGQVCPTPAELSQGFADDDDDDDDE